MKSIFSICQKVWHIWSRNIFSDRKKSRPFKRVMMPFGETEIQEANSWTEEIYLFYEEISLFWRSKSQKNWITRRKSNICHIPGSRIFKMYLSFGNVIVSHFMNNRVFNMSKVTFSSNNFQFQIRKQRCVLCISDPNCEQNW